MGIALSTKMRAVDLVFGARLRFVAVRTMPEIISALRGPSPGTGHLGMDRCWYRDTGSAVRGDCQTPPHVCCRIQKLSGIQQRIEWTAPAFLVDRYIAVFVQISDVPPYTQPTSGCWILSRLDFGLKIERLLGTSESNIFGMLAEVIDDPVFQSSTKSRKARHLQLSVPGGPTRSFLRSW